MRSIEIQIKEWRDKTFGNNYFSACIYIDTDEGDASKGTIYVPFQYGDGSHAEDVCHKEIQKVLKLSDPHHHYKETCNIHGFYYYSNIEKGCKKKDVTCWGKQD